MASRDMRKFNAVGHLVIFDRGAGKRWEDRIFRREEPADGGRRITVWAM